MADDDTQETQDTQTGTSPAGESSESKERTFSQAELDAIVAKRVAKAEKSAEKRVRQEIEGQPAQKKDPQPASGSEDLAAKLAALEAKAAWHEAVAELDWKPTKDDAELLRDAFKSGGADAMQKLANRLKPQDAAKEETKVDDSAKYKSPGAPSGAPSDVLERDATKWSRDHIERLRSEGSFLKELEKYRGSLPGGGGGVFRKRIPQAR